MTDTKISELWEDGQKWQFKDETHPKWTDLFMDGISDKWHKPPFHFRWSEFRPHPNHHPGIYGKYLEIVKSLKKAAEDRLKKWLDRARPMDDDTNDLLTVKGLIDALKKYPEDAVVNAYEGEVNCIRILSDGKQIGSINTWCPKTI